MLTRKMYEKHITKNAIVIVGNLALRENAKKYKDLWQFDNFHLLVVYIISCFHPGKYDVNPGKYDVHPGKCDVH